MSELCEWLKRWRFRHLRHVWHDMRQRTEAFEKGIGSNVQFERINLKLQTSKKMFWRFSWLRFTQTTQAFTRTTEGFMKTSIMVWICYNIFESYTFAWKLKFCPKGRPDWTTEESAAHHFHWKTYFDTPGIHPNDRGTHLKTCSFEFQSLRKNPKNLIQISTENQFKCIFLDARILKSLQMELSFHDNFDYGVNLL